jgi:hypothetical protein
VYPAISSESDFTSKSQTFETRVSKLAPELRTLFETGKVSQTGETAPREVALTTT